MLSCPRWLPRCQRGDPSRAEVARRSGGATSRLVDGSTLKAAELEGRTVVVEFWASWCPFCAKQNPFIEKLHRQAGGDSLRVLTFSIDKTEQAARDYSCEHGYTFAAAMAGAAVGHMVRPPARPAESCMSSTRRGRIVFSEIGEMFEEDIAALARFAAKAQ